jgi:hypothetical protein
MFIFKFFVYFFLYIFLLRFEKCSDSKNILLWKFYKFYKMFKIKVC